MSYLQSAFDQVCQESKRPGQWFVCLTSRYQAYGGPEEGGWYYSVCNVEAFQVFPTEEAASDAAERVRNLAKELESDARRAHGERCLREMEWLDARGLDADYLPEPDGPEEYDVSVCDELPTYDNHRPQYC